MDRKKLNQEEQFDIFEARAEEMEHVLGFIRDLAIYEKAEKEVDIDLETLKRDGFGEQKRFESYICYVDAKPAGMCLFYHRYSTWKGLTLYLEDIYIDPSYRRMGIAGSLMKLLIKVAKERNCGRFEWQVLDWNEPAIKFYRSLGAELDPEWINGKMSRQDLEAFEL